MKYLKKFNEELNASTYRSAAFKLKKLGEKTGNPNHLDRHKELLDWSEKAFDKELLKRWEENKKRFSKFGEFKLKITNKETKKSFIGKFYLDISLSKDSFGEDLEDIRHSGEGYIWIPIGLIPIDEETKDHYDSLVPGAECTYVGGLSITINFTLDSKIEFTKYDIENYDDSYGIINISDRASAGKFKRLLVSIFSDPNLNYPAWGYDSFYDMMNIGFGSELGPSDYGFQPEQISDFISTISANEMY